ncbi:signal-regulatory protein beta-2-like [Centroberyx affinis]|uniref:signal-regulatory protein beta-2-like n=1 Tax=Centroberyx affinis TaxID=166261 RepID=UPI003A5BDF59
MMEQGEGKMMVYLLNVFLICNLCVAQFNDISQPVSFQTVELGDPVTIECQINSVIRSRVWYKLTTGRRLQRVATIDTQKNQIKFGKQFNQFNQRYSVKHDGIKNDLSISTTTWGDIGTYYCGVVYQNFIEFGSGTHLMLKDPKMSSDSVVQQPVSMSVQPGDSVTLNCSVHTGNCAGEYTSVFWLKNSQNSGRVMIYTPGNKSDNCEKTETGFQQTSCVYNLPKKNLSSADAGTYYCVVASCGEILSGNGTELNIKRNSTLTTPPLDWTPTVVVVVLALSNIVLGIATLVLIWALCKSRSKNPTEETDGSSEGNQTSDAVHYAAVSLAPRSSSSRPAKVKHSRDAILYSEVRHRQQV